jgi:hypothetical protein
MHSSPPDLRVDRATLGDRDPASLAWAVIAPAYDAVGFHDGPDAFADSMRARTPGQRALLALQWCVAEVSNGGFDQFFLNPTGLLAADAIDAYLERHEPLEERFYALVESVLYPTAAVYVRAHPEEFVR